MSFIGAKDFLIEVAKGNVPGHAIVHKFGRNTAVGTTFVPVTLGGIYLTPQAASATTLRVKAGDANDTAAGSGAREVTVIVVNEAGAEITEAIATAGASASSATTVTAMRLIRGFVSASGTYVGVTGGSHAADIVIENGAGGTDWATLSVTDFARSQTEIGFYTIPTGKTAYLLFSTGFTDTAKITNLMMIQRGTILDAAAPYSAMRMLFEVRLEGGEEELKPRSPIVVAGPADIGFIAKVDAGTAEVDVDFELLIVDD